MNTKRKKQRGAGRRLKALLRNIDGIRPFVRTNDATEHFHVPCGGFIDSRRTRGKIKTEFIEKNGSTPRSGSSNANPKIYRSAVWSP